MRYLQLSTFIVLASAFMNFAYSVEVLWADEFSGTSLNPGTWDQHYPGERFSGFNDASATKVTDHKLTITSVFRDGKNYTGMISTRDLKEVNSGYLELKARLSPMRDGLKCSALLQSPLFGNKDVDAELLPENTGSVVTLFQLTATAPDRFYSSVAWGDYSENAHRSGDYSDVEFVDNQFYVFGLNMLDDKYEFYLNGKKYLEVSEGISGVEMYLVLSCEIKDNLGVFDIAGKPNLLTVDYVRFMDSRPPMPKNTTQQLKQDDNLKIENKTRSFMSKAQTGQMIQNDMWKMVKGSTVNFGNHDTDIGFEQSQPDDKDAIKVTLVKNSHLGVDASFILPDNVEEAWVSYCMRFSSNWTTQTGGKLPGFAGDSAGPFSGGGQGGSPSDGTNSWSARMLYGEFNSKTNSIPIGSYVYHTDQAANGDYGDVDWWAQEPHRLIKDSASLEHDKWYSITQHIRINTENNNDGVLEGWVDGKLAYSRKNFNFTNAKRHRKIYRIWLDIYHGGSETSPTDQYVYFDQFNYSVGEDPTSVYCN